MQDAQSHYQSNQASRGQVTDQIVARGSFKDIKLGHYTDGPRTGQKFVAKFMRSVDPYLASVYKHELKIVKRTHKIVQRFEESGIAPVAILLNKPTLWEGGGSGDEWTGTRHLVEPFIENYQKFNSNTGWVTKKDLGALGDALQALSHFSYHDSGPLSKRPTACVRTEAAARFARV